MQHLLDVFLASPEEGKPSVAFAVEPIQRLPQLGNPAPELFRYIIVLFYFGIPGIRVREASH
jgi:hypothetical protein